VSTTKVTIEIDHAKLASYSDEFLAACWHAAQWNPAPHVDHAPGELAERISREIIRRWLRVPPELWRHQGRDYYRFELSRLAWYEPGDGPGGSTARNAGEWALEAAGSDSQAGDLQDGAW
jgi:hypothetical protein